MIFLDSSFLISFGVEKDSNHEKAVEVMKEIAKGKYGEAFISDYIFDETITVTLARTKSLSKAVIAGTGMKKSYSIEKVDDRIFEEAWGFFQSQKQTIFSFTDCTNIFVMQESNIKNIATFDEDFKKVKGINVIS